jgi:flagellar hook-basal body complex protein FliE
MKIRPDMVAPALMKKPASPTGGAKGFADLLAKQVAEVDQTLKVADHKSAELLVGRGSIHETMIALEEAGIQLRVVGAVRDRVVSAYQDLTRMQI